MKTSNKLLLVFALAAFLSTASIMMYAKTQLVTMDEYYEEMQLSGKTMDKVLQENVTNSNIEMGDNFSWTLDPNSTQLVVRGDETIVSKLTISDNGQLQIRTGGHGDYNIDYAMVFVTVGIKNLSQLRLDGNGNAKISTSAPLNLEGLDLEMNGNSKTNLEVNTADIKMNVNGNSKVTLKGVCDAVNSHVSGNGRAFTEELSTKTVMISASGNARYYGGIVENITGNASGNAFIEVDNATGKNSVSTSGNGRFTINR